MVNSSSLRHCIYRPSGRKLRSKNEIKDYSDKNSLNLDLSTFGFSRPRKDKYPPAPSPSKTATNKRLKPANPVASAIVETKENGESTAIVSQDSSSTNTKVEMETTTSNGNNSEVSKLSNEDSNEGVKEFQLSSLIDEEMKAFAEEILKPASLDVILPNTSFSSVKTSSNDSNVCTENDRNEPDLAVLEQDQLDSFGKTFKIERPISFSCF